MFTQNPGQENMNKVREKQDDALGDNVNKSKERLKMAQDIVEKFPVTGDMFPQASVRPTWIVCK